MSDKALPDELLAALASGSRIKENMEAMGAAGKLPFQMHITDTEGKPDPTASAVVTICGNILITMADSCQKSGANMAQVYIAMIAAARFLVWNHCPEDMRDLVTADAIEILKGKVLEA